MILTEANDLSFVQKFKEAKEPSDIIPIIQEFLGTCGFNGYTKDEYDNFVTINSNALYIECQKYTLSMENPFFMFIHEYSRQNGNITPFLSKDNWNILHNCVSNGILSEKQLSFKCPEIEQVRIIVNPYLWNMASKPDILYLLKVYSWAIDENLNNYVINAYVRAAFADKVILDNGKIDYDEPDLDKVVNKVGLLKCLFFTDYINVLSEEKIKNTAKTPASTIEQIQKKVLSVKSQNMLVSHEFVSVDLIEQQIKVLRETVQESGRDVNGRYQKTDTDKEKDTTQINKLADRFTAKEKSNILSKSDSIINAVKSTFGVKNKSDIRDILKALGDIY